MAGAAATVLSMAVPVKPAQACASQPYLAATCVFAGNFAPRGWAFAQGQILPINTNQSLYSLLGTTYGGDGRTSFALPDTRGRRVIGTGQGPGLSNYALGAKGGQETVALNTLQLPSHTHSVAPGAVSGLGNTASPSGAVPAQVAGVNRYSTSTPDVAMRATTSSNTGGNQAHENRPPYIAMNWIIALQGIFPSRN
jgi:microcystin-dependent protein